MFERIKYSIDRIDPELFAAMEQENQRQEEHIELIAFGKLCISGCDGCPRFAAHQ